MRFQPRPFLLATLLLAGCVRDGARNADADLVLVNARVYTLAGDATRAADATALAVRGERIVYVGDDRGAETWRGDHTRWLDTGGATVLPGLVDAHGHLIKLGRLLQNVQLFDTRSPAEVLQRVQARLREAPAGSWVRGRGWDQNDWEEKSFPTWRDLAGTESHVVVLERVDGHASWLNRTALERCGITRATPDPPGGLVVRDAQGEPTGVLVDNAEFLVDSRIPPESAAETDTLLLRAIRECNRLGLVGVHDAGTTRTTLESLRRLGARKALTLNVYVLLESDEPDLVRERLAAGPASEFNGRLVVRALKLRADGALGSRGAALLEPYSDDPRNRGLDVDPPDSLLAWTRAAVLRGFQVGTHAIGDGGNRRVLDVYEQVLRETSAEDARLRVEHAQIIALGDIPRFAALGVIASMQPVHATSDMPWAEARVGSNRIAGGYAWRSLLDSGAVLAFGSDFPTDTPSPLLGIYAGVTRQDEKGNPPGGWRAGECLSVDETVRAYTQGAAYAAFDEAEAGVVAVGKRADLTILDTDPFTAPAHDLLKARVRVTIVRGAVVYTSR